jgi:uncharacterized protein YndB with AHSA1/START domain
MAAITATVEVSRPADEVFAYATDPNRFQEWQKGVVDGRLDAVSEAQVGSRCVTVRRIGFANRPITSEITSVDAPRQWSVRGIDGPIRARVDVDVEPLTAERSRLTITLDFEGHGIGRLLVPMFVVRGARKEMPDNLDQLRRRLQQPKRSA